MTTGSGGISRRGFLAGSAAWLALHGLGLSRASLASEMAAPQSTLAVAVGDDPGTIVRAAVEALGGIAAFVRRGQNVLIKPNVGWDRAPEQAANTNPAVVRALVQMCLDAGAGSVTVLDRTCNDARRCYRTSGIEDMMAAIGDRRARLEHVIDGRFRPVRIPQGRVLTEWPVYGAALDTDVLINVPIAKHHSISTLTLGMKNLMGVLGGNRGSLHSDIGQKLADIASAVRPALNVLDATRILFRNGPTGGRLEDVRAANTVAASADIVALDAYGATLFGLRPEEVPTVAAAASMGIGQMDLSRVRVLEL